MTNDTPQAETQHEQYLTYCIRCGKPPYSGDVYYSKDDPDHEESLCSNCYKRFEEPIESEE